MQEFAIRPDILDLEVLGRDAADVSILFTTTSSALDLARQMHDFGSGRQAPFRTIVCSGRQARLEKQLRDALGPETSGTVFLADVHCLSLDLQDRLLALLDRASRARVMASTSEPLLQRMLDGSFNDRLFYRLNSVHVIVPDSAGARA